MTNRLFCCVLSILFLLSARAEITYTVTPDPANNALHVSIDVPAKGKTTDVQIPNWSPGAYILSNFKAGIKNLKGVGPSGDLTTSQVDDNTWRVENGSAKNVTVNYDLGMTMNSGAAHYSGPPTYVYVVGRKEEKCKLVLNVPAGWMIAIGLDEVKGAAHTYTAANYDVLADNPVTMGNFRLLSYTVMGKPHYIAMRGAARANVDGATVKKQCMFVSQSEADFFGFAPYNKYVWHFDVADRPDGGGGLEHLSSTQISLPSGLGPRSFNVLAHEFFHLWNVKRIRSKPLGPFDYLHLPKTGALWWLEGVTDYYAYLLPMRYGWNDEKKFYSDIVSNVTAARNNPARLEVGPNESSMRVGETNNGRGNSNGYRISYYTLGWLAGMCLDLEIRTQTNGKRSLDDVEHALYEICKDGKPGFEEDEIRKQCVRFGGASLGPFYDSVVMKGGEMPIEAELAKVGLQLIKTEESFPERGFSWVADSGQQAARVIGRPTGAAEGRLMEGDLITSVNGIPVTGRTNREINQMVNEQLNKAQIGVKMNLEIKREGKTMSVEITPVAGTRPVQRIEEMTNATAKMRALRKGWFYAGTR